MFIILTLKQIKTNGINAFDTASLNEAKLVRGLFPNAEIFSISALNNFNIES